MLIPFYFQNRGWGTYVDVWVEPVGFAPANSAFLAAPSAPISPVLRESETFEISWQIKWRKKHGETCHWAPISDHSWLRLILHELNKKRLWWISTIARTASLLTRNPASSLRHAKSLPQRIISEKYGSKGAQEKWAGCSHEGDATIFLLWTD